MDTLTGILSSTEVKFLLFIALGAGMVGYALGEQRKHVVYDVPNGYVRTDYVNAEIFSLRKKLANFESQNQ